MAPNKSHSHGNQVLPLIWMRQKTMQNERNCLESQAKDGDSPVRQVLHGLIVCEGVSPGNYWCRKAQVVTL